MTSLHPRCQVRWGWLGATFPLIVGVRNQHLVVPYSNPVPRRNVGRWTQWWRVWHKSRLLCVADPHISGVEINLGIMPYQWEVTITAARRDHKLTSDGHLPRSEDPHSGTCRHDRSVILPNHRMWGKSTNRAHSTTSGTRGSLVHWWWSTLITVDWLATNHGRSVGHLRRWRASSSSDLICNI
jgi:hypothetical protein